MEQCPKLTDDHVERLSHRLTKGYMMRLAPKLHISSEQVTKTFAKYGPNEALAVNSSQDELWIQKANHDILTNWLNNQSSEEDAYVLMNNALVASGLKLLATETLYSSRRALTIDHLQALCLSLTEKDLKRLKSEMGIPVQDLGETIEVSNPDKRDVRMGMLGILMVWFKAQKSAEEAHEALTTTLKRIGLKFVAQLMNSNSLEILLKNLNLTPGRKSTEQQSILRTQSESRESKVAEPNPLCNSAPPGLESVSTSVSIPDPECHVVSDSILLSAPEIPESELAFSSESEAIALCHQKVVPKFSFLPDASFIESDLELISDSTAHWFPEEPSSHLLSEDMKSNVEVVYHRLQAEHSLPITESDRQNLSELDTIPQSEPHNQKLSEHNTQKLSEPDKQKLSQPDKQKLSEPDKQKLSEPDKQKLSEPDKQKLSEPNKQKLSEPDKQKLSESDKQKLSEPDKQKLSEPDKQKLSEHNKQILEQERIEKRLHELKRARLEREKLEREREKITRLKKNAIKIESKSETKVRVPQLAS